MGLCSLRLPRTLYNWVNVDRIRCEEKRLLKSVIVLGWLERSILKCNNGKSEQCGQ